MVKLVVTEDRAVVDKVTSSIVISEEEAKGLRAEIGTSISRESKYEVLKSSGLSRLDGITYIIDPRHATNDYVLRASWNPQTEASNQNVMLAVEDNGFVLDGVKLAKRPFEKLALESSLRLHEKVITWNRVDIATYTPEIPEDVDLLAWLVKAYEPTFQAQGDTITRSAAAAVKTKFTKFSKGSRVSGVRWVRTSGDHTLYTITVYRKESAVAKRAAQAESSKMGDFEKKVALNNAKLVSSVGNRLRVELQLYPDAFFRGKAAEFRSILGEVSNAQADLRNSDLVDRITEERAKNLFRAATVDIGLKFSLYAWNKATLEKKLREVRDPSGLVDRWMEGESILRKNPANSSWDKRVMKSLGFRPCDIPFEMFVWLRKSLELFMTSDIVQADSWERVGSGKDKEYFLAYRKKIRQIGWHKTFLFRE